VPDPRRPGARSREHHTIAVALNESPKLVFSRTLNDVTWRNARLVRELDPTAIAAMKQQPGKGAALAVGRRPAALRALGPSPLIASGQVLARRRSEVPRPMKMMLAVHAAISGGSRSARAKASATKWTTR
jgi:hypothetical protein